MTGFVDPLISRKSAITDEGLVKDKQGFPLPAVVEISESGTCNRTCSFCPRSAPNFPDIKEFIDPGLINKLSRQLGEAGFKGLFLFSGFVEPLLDKNIYNLISTVRENLPDSRVELVTNGDVLDHSRLLRLFESGLSTLLISVYDGEEDAIRFKVMCQKAGLSGDQFKIRNRYLPPENDFGITLNNRAGMMSNAEHALPALMQASTSPCNYPHYTFFMDYLGDVLQCPHDWGKRLIVGNMKKQDFIDIWMGQILNEVRKRLARGDRGYSPCNVCDVKGTLIGNKHVQAWEKFSEAGKKT